jgi:hypothetical protein
LTTDSSPYFDGMDPLLREPAVKIMRGRIEFAKNCSLCTRQSVAVLGWGRGAQVPPNLIQVPKFSSEVNLRADHVLVEESTLGPGPQI